VEVVFRDEAVADLEEIGDYIARESPQRARDFVAEMKARCIDIGDNPRAAPRLAGWGKNVRRVVFGSYLIAYRIDASRKEVVVLRVVHGARDIKRLKM
jgi:toxin ParE1/3/4